MDIVSQLGQRAMSMAGGRPAKAKKITILRKKNLKLEKGISNPRSPLWGKMMVLCGGKERNDPGKSPR